MSPTDAASTPPKASWKRFLAGNAMFLGFHLATVIMLCYAGVPDTTAIGLCLGLYVVRMFAITGGYHRYFSHKTYKTSRAFQFFLALLGNLSLQRGAIWWAAHHRWHHRYSDTERDVHSPKQGLFWSHMGWVVDPSATPTRKALVKDLLRYPELRVLEHYLVMVGLFAAMCCLVFFTLGFQALTYACFLSTVLLWHGTFTINSLSHIWGKRVYATSDTSRNNPLLALITLGEGWHNNHHYYPVVCAQGFRWYEFDIAYRVIWCLEKVGLVWDVKRPSAEVVAGRLGRRNWIIADQGVADAHAPIPLEAPASAASAADEDEAERDAEVIAVAAPKPPVLTAA